MRKGLRLRLSGGLPDETTFVAMNMNMTTDLTSCVSVRHSGPCETVEKHFVVCGSSRGLVRDSHIVRESYIQK